MTPPLFLVEPGELAAAGEQLVLSGSEGRHAATVRRLQAGERVDCADGTGSVARCTVASVGRDAVVLSVVVVEHVPEPEPRLILVQALAKGEHGELAVRAATEVGVDEIWPWAARRAVVRWEGERGERAHERWTATAREAAKQSRRARQPSVRAALTTGQLRGALAGLTAALLLDGAADCSLADVPLTSVGAIALVVGPEGGIDDAEQRELLAAGAVAVRMGPTVLRTSTAGVAALAVVAARSGRW